MRRSRIAGLGSYLPDWVVTNDDLKQWMDTTDEWIQERTGIRQRHWVRPGEKVGPSDLALEASRRALVDAGVEAKDVQMVIFATLSPDHFFPGSGVFLQRKLGVPVGAAVLDIRQQCTGFIYGLSIADQFIRTGMYERVLVVGAEIHSTGLDISTRGRDLAVLFGDGAGAALVTADGDEKSHIVATHLHADGTFAEALWVEYPSAKEHPAVAAAEIAEKTRHFPQMKGKHVFKYACTHLPEAVFEAFVRSGIPVDELKMLIPHQANLRINDYVTKLLGLPPEKVFNNIDHVGNTTAASIPIAMDECRRLGKIARGDLVCLAAFGAGFTWGSALVRY